jgi:hypothetical protein
VSQHVAGAQPVIPGRLQARRSTLLDVAAHLELRRLTEENAVLVTRLGTMEEDLR